jgi:hypothetical protein
MEIRKFKTYRLVYRQRFPLVFGGGGVLVRISTGTPAILVKGFPLFPQFLQENLGIVIRLSDNYFPSKSFQI